MESSDKRVFGIVTVAIVTTMVTALAILRSQAIEARKQLSQPELELTSEILANQRNAVQLSIGNR